MGKESDIEFVRSDPTAPTEHSRSGLPRKAAIDLKINVIALGLLGGISLVGATYLSAVEEVSRKAFADQTVGHCFKTGIGAVGMAVNTGGTGSISLIFLSGLKTTYDREDLVETACPSSSAQ